MNNIKLTFFLEFLYEIYFVVDKEEHFGICIITSSIIKELF